MPNVAISTVISTVRISYKYHEPPSRGNSVLDLRWMKVFVAGYLLFFAFFLLFFGRDAINKVPTPDRIGHKAGFRVLRLSFESGFLGCWGVGFWGLRFGVLGASGAIILKGTWDHNSYMPK